MTKLNRTMAFAAATLGILALMPMAVAAENPNFATIDTNGSTLEFTVNLRGVDHMILTVSGPDRTVVRQEFSPSGSGEFNLYDDAGYARPDGSYTWELKAIPCHQCRVEARASSPPGFWQRPGRYRGAARCRNYFPASPPSTKQVISPSRVASFVDPSLIEDEGGFGLATPQSTETSYAPQSSETSGPTSAYFDFVILDDLIVDGSACIGFDCVDGESFGFDTIRLKENNLRIGVDDTSVAASYPRNDWQLTFNDSANGGASKFSVDDISGGRTPFTIEANARSHSLYVDDGGRLGLRTSTPSVEIHTIDGDTPTLRLQQDGSSGFAPQTWDVAGNETNFFVRDVTNGSQLPFRIRPDAPTSSIFIDVNGDVGLATSSPDASLHVLRIGEEDATGLISATGSSNHANLTISETNTDTDNDTMFELNSAGGAPVHAVHINVSHLGNHWWKFLPHQHCGGGARELELDPSGGSCTLTGTVAANGGADTLPDYVFEPDYNLMALSELKEFIEEEKHLPGVPSKADVTKAEGIINMTEMQMKLLEKIEELTLYTLEQEDTIRNQQNAIQAFEARLASLEQK